MEYGKRNGNIKPWQVGVLMVMSAVFAAGVVVLVLLSGMTRYRIADVESEYDASLISKLAAEIDNYYYFDEDLPKSRKLIEQAAHSLVDAVGDPYAAYYTIEEYYSFRNEMNGNYKGIGVLVSQTENEGLFVNRAYDGNPAYEAGIRDGDYIVSVDDVSVIGLELGTASDMLLGEDGSIAKITVVRGGTTMNFSVPRGDVYVRRVYSNLLDGNVGYILIESFTGNAADEFDAELDALLESGITSLIIDVRNNPGGSLDVVVDICDRVLPACDITTIEGKLVDPPKVYSSTDEEYLSIPYVVLTNGYSASASEIFASSIQDNEQGTILGTTTFGKGIVQTSWNIGGDMGYIKLTTDAYRTPNGTLIHGIGVTPDIVVEQAEELSGLDPYYLMRDFMEQDVQLHAAIEFLLGE